MKSVKLITCLSILILLSCSKEELIIENVTANSLEILAEDLNLYENMSLGMYKGVFSTQDSERRGVIEVEVISDEVASAKITYVDGEIEYYEGIISNSLDLMAVEFVSENSSFIFNVHEDGTNPIIKNANSHATPSFITVVKENVRGAVVPLTGTFETRQFSPNQGSGTWSIIFISGNGEGDNNDITTQTIFNGDDFGSTTGSIQDDCNIISDNTICSLSGAYTSQGVDIQWSGIHLYPIATDCSYATGTWSTNNDFSGTFITDTICPPPSNDVCENAISITCNDSFTETTVLATRIGNPSNCGANVGIGIWYVYTDSGMGDEITISTAGSSFDTTLNIYTGSCDNLDCFGANDDALGTRQSEVTFTEVGDSTTQYYILASGFADLTGTLITSVTCN